MARTENRQLGYVGNLGDIIKHAALVELSLLLARGRSKVSFVDTHAFQLHAPLPDRARWESDVDTLASRHSAYGTYAALEHASLALTGHYRCSSGLMLDVLGDRRASAVLGEANAASRAELTSQLAAEDVAKRTNVLLAHDAAAVDRESTIPAGGALLVHVDPFALSLETWSTFAPALHSMAARSAETVMVLYRYSRNARTPWPDARADLVTLVAETRGGPHEVCALASPDIADSVRGVCGALGWTLTRSH